MSSEPRVGGHPILQTVQFQVIDCPRVVGPWKGAHFITPERVVVEKRPRGTRFKVLGRTKDGYRREVVFNLHGYERNQAAPPWLLTLWAEVQEGL
jgi:hypothetical protein